MLRYAERMAELKAEYIHEKPPIRSSDLLSVSCVRFFSSSVCGAFFLFFSVVVLLLLEFDFSLSPCGRIGCFWYGRPCVRVCRVVLWRATILVCVQLRRCLLWFCLREAFPIRSPIYTAPHYLHLILLFTTFPLFSRALCIFHSHRIFTFHFPILHSPHFRSLSLSHTYTDTIHTLCAFHLALTLADRFIMVFWLTDALSCARLPFFKCHCHRIHANSMKIHYSGCERVYVCARARSSYASNHVHGTYDHGHAFVCVSDFYSHHHRLFVPVFNGSIWWSKWKMMRAISFDGQPIFNPNQCDYLMFSLAAAYLWGLYIPKVSQTYNVNMNKMNCQPYCRNDMWTHSANNHQVHRTIHTHTVQNGFEISGAN